MTEPCPCPGCGAAIPSDAPAGACPRCLVAAGFPTGGAPLPEVPAAEVERRFPEYEIRGTLGRGGMGIVFRARQRSLDREVALKVLPGAPWSAGLPADFPDRFRREAKALARLQHPGIVQIFDVATSGDGWCMLAMELVEGQSLRQVLASRRVAPREALAVVPQICDALQYAHDQGVVHRDIKPENVLLTREGRVKIADFGLAKLIEGTRDGSLTHSGHRLGTPHYMAPEQVERPGDVDHRADIFSLGVVFYEMLTGELPIGRFAAPSLKTDVDGRIDEIVLRTLEKERGARYQRASDVRSSIESGGGAARSRSVRDWLHGATAPGAPRMSRLAVATAVSGVALPLSQVLLWSWIGDANPAQRWTAVHAWSWVAWSGLLLLGVTTVLRCRSNPQLQGRALAGMGLAAGTALIAAFGASLGAETNRLQLARDQEAHARRPAAATAPGGFPWAPQTGLGGVAGPQVIDGLEFPATTHPQSMRTALEAHHANAIRALYGRLQAMWPVGRDAQFISQVLADADAAYVQSLTEEEFSDKSMRGLLGLPNASKVALGCDLHELACSSIAIDERRTLATLTLVEGRRVIVAEVERSKAGALEESPWRFAMRPIRSQ